MVVPDTLQPDAAIKGTKNGRRNTEEQADLAVGAWERKLAWRDTEFAREGETHPHRIRRAAILKRHPAVRLLMRKDVWIFPIVVLAVANHMLLAWIVRSWTGVLGWIGIAAVACVLGGSLASFLAIALHECTHGLVFKAPLANRLLALFANTGTPVPTAMGFRRYHSDHHAFQGDRDRDPDMPLDWELRAVRGQPWLKVLWLAVYPVMYAVRATVRGKTLTAWEAVNFATVAATNAAIWTAMGPRAFAYVLISFAYGYTFHPVAAHFLQEHYTFYDGQETYNYYGWANTLFLNMGFHNEHHDFPGVPGRLLPLVTAAAPEFYAPLKSHRSWRGVLWAFLSDTNIGPQARCARA